MFSKSKLFALPGEAGSVRELRVQELFEVLAVLEAARVRQVHQVSGVSVLSGAYTARGDAREHQELQLY